MNELYDTSNWVQSVFRSIVYPSVPEYSIVYPSIALIHNNLLKPVVLKNLKLIFLKRKEISPNKRFLILKKTSFKFSTLSGFSKLYMFANLYLDFEDPLETNIIVEGTPSLKTQKVKNAQFWILRFKKVDNFIYSKIQIFMQAHHLFDIIHIYPLCCFFYNSLSYVID